ncbi:hypothetical protein GcC1_c10634o5 [Golovinomyces cichoracearum]|uniref:Uncharacterized protein n=1 Tax=Golovinomyces cichoracearum TaxID=62708 RepID=A0A420J8U0_9PEZI|nr:hypothetical protein GcC1_c10634o5 [Golovinomyces cichoracearum]
MVIIFIIRLVSILSHLSTCSRKKLVMMNTSKYTQFSVFLGVFF